MSEINTELLTKVMDFIESNTELHEQGTWAAKIGSAYEEVHDIADGFEPVDCGSACCFAGWAAQFAGYRFKWYPGSGSTDWAISPDDPEGPVIGIWQAASEALGIDERTADALFDGSNDRENLRLLVDELVTTGSLAYRGLDDYYEHQMQLADES